MNSITNIIEAPLLLLGAFNSGGIVPPNNHCNIVTFLRTHECEELAPAFIAEEIEVRQIAQLSNEDLLSLGVRTIGARLHLHPKVLSSPVLKTTKVKVTLYSHISTQPRWASTQVSA